MKFEVLHLKFFLELSQQFGYLIMDTNENDGGFYPVVVENGNTH